MSVVDDSGRLYLRPMFEDYMHRSADTELIKVKDRTFELTHLRLKAAGGPVPQLNWCAAKRVVIEEPLFGKVSGLHGKLKDDQGEFVYACYLMSPFLDEFVRPERTGFNIPETSEGALDEDELSLSDIRSAVLASAAEYLKSSLAEAQEAGRARVEQFVNNKAPRYRPILRHIDKGKLSVDPTIGDKELELQLHRHLTDLDIELLAEGQRVLETENVQEREYSERLQEYLEKIDDIKKSDLAAYVSRRRLILDLMAKAIESDQNGKYAKEDVVHSLIMPMRTTSDDAEDAASNLWIIEEGLAFHNYLASDKPLSSMPITGSSSRLEPDLIALKVTDGPVLVAEGQGTALASIVIVEIKRPMRDDASPDRDPLTQVWKYLERVREGKIRTVKGRPIQRPEDIPAFCYVIADLTTTVEDRCRYAGLRRTHDGRGYFGYNDNLKAYTEVISFDRLLDLARQRNRAFFDRLGLPVN